MYNYENMRLLLVATGLYHDCCEYVYAIMHLLLVATCLFPCLKMCENVPSRAKLPPEADFASASGGNLLFPLPGNVPSVADPG